MHEYQYGFTPNKSTEHAIQKMQDVLKMNESKNLHSIIISIDIQAAFDSIRWKDLIKILEIISCPQDIRHIIKDYLCNRTLQYSSDSGVINYKLTKGCPQGSCLRPTFWNLIANEVLKLCDNINHTHIQAYADDFLLIVNASRRKSIEINSGYSLKIFRNWTDKFHLKISTTKCKALYIPKRGTSINNLRKPIIRISQEKIKVDKSITYHVYLTILALPYSISQK
ncbi:Retrovirus-related Pol polyprotein from type-1 retrotransposable element R1, partial [Stegodyphus mimosarum]